MLLVPCYQSSRSLKNFLPLQFNTKSEVPLYFNKPVLVLFHLSETMKPICLMANQQTY